jgi:DNA-binding HxlR family transcriptional regulator
MASLNCRKKALYFSSPLEAAKRRGLTRSTREEHGVVRFTRLGMLVGDISQKMLTKTVRQMERDGLITRTVHPVIPPRVEYELTALGRRLGEAFCGVWIWAARHGGEIERARAAFKERV